MNSRPKNETLILDFETFDVKGKNNLFLYSRAGQFKFFSAGIAGSLEDIYLSIFCYKTYTFNQGPEALHKAKVERKKTFPSITRSKSAQNEKI